MLVDAEQTYMQPAIDAVTLALQMTYNKEGAVVMNTYQCYLKVDALPISLYFDMSCLSGGAVGCLLT